MGHGSSIPQNKKGVQAVQVVRAGARFKAGVGHKGPSTSQGQGESKEVHDERERTETKRYKKLQYLHYEELLII